MRWQREERKAYAVVRFKGCGAWGALVNILGRNVKLEYTAPNVAARRKAVLTLEWKVHRDESQHVHRPWLQPGKRVLPPRRIPTLGAC